MRSIIRETVVGLLVLAAMLVVALSLTGSLEDKATQSMQGTAASLSLVTVVDSKCISNGDLSEKDPKSTVIMILEGNTEQVPQIALLQQFL